MTAAARPSAEPDSDASVERRLAAAVIGAVTVLFVVFLLIAPPGNPTYDDAKYIGVGRSVLAGLGPTTLFGTLFLKHAPVWPVAVTAPEALIGADPIAVGHLLNAVSIAAILALVGRLGWAVRPAVGALSVVALAGVPYTFSLARTGGIDLPSIALTFAYLIVGFRSVERGSVRLGLVAGFLFGLSFLIKETILPFAPVPFLAGAIRAVPWARLATVAAATLLTAAITLSWWFWMYVGYTGRVYRADFPGWTLVPITIGIVVAIVLGARAEPIAVALRRRGWPARLTDRLPARWQARARPIVGWLLVLGWFGFLYVFFSRTPKLLGNSLLDPGQVAGFVRTTLASALRLAVVYSLGILLLVRWRPGGEGGRALTDLVVATICGIPLVLLVIGVGETARHYVAVVALAIILATAGWLTALDRVIRARDRTAAVGLLAVGALAAIATVGSIGFTNPRLPRDLLLGAAAAVGAVAVGGLGARWLARRGRLDSAALAIVVAVVAVGALGVVGVRAVRLDARIGRAEAAASGQAADWVVANVPVGTAVAFGPYLSMQISIGLPAGSDVVQLRHFLATADPSSPLGLRSATGHDDDLIAVDPAAGKSNQYNVYASDQITTTLQASHVRFWVYPVAEGVSSAQILHALTPDAGFTEVATLRDTSSPRAITVHIFRIDLDRLALVPDRLWISKDALERLTAKLQAAGAGAKAAAQRLVERVQAPADGSMDGALATLRSIAGR